MKSSCCTEVQRRRSGPTAVAHLILILIGKDLLLVFSKICGAVDRTSKKFSSAGY